MAGGRKVLLRSASLGRGGQGTAPCPQVSCVLPLGFVADFASAVHAVGFTSGSCSFFLGLSAAHVVLLCNNNVIEVFGANSILNSALSKPSPSSELFSGRGWRDKRVYL